MNRPSLDFYQIATLDVVIVTIAEIKSTIIVIIS